MTRRVREACPKCGSQPVKNNGQMHTGQQNHQCKGCGRQLSLRSCLALGIFVGFCNTFSDKHDQIPRKK